MLRLGAKKGNKSRSGLYKLLQNKQKKKKRSKKVYFKNHSKFYGIVSPVVVFYVGLILILLDWMYSSKESFCWLSNEIYEKDIIFLRICNWYILLLIY